MERYQIRSRKPLERVFDEIAAAAWQWIAPLAPGHDQDGPAKVREVLEDRLSRRLHRYDVCGEEIFCTEAIGRRPLLPKDGEMDERTDPNLRADADIYHLIVDNDLDTFLDALTSAVWHGLATAGIVQEPRPTADARRRLRIGIRAGLASYIYYCAVCGTDRVCKHAREIGLGAR